MKDYANRPLALFLFPCNQFFKQEPDGAPSCARVSRMSKNMLDLTASNVQMMAEVNVNGEDASEVFQFLKYNSSLYNDKSGMAKPISWNFNKFLVNPKGGGVYKHYAESAAWFVIREDIDLLLGHSSPQSSARKSNIVRSSVRVLPQQVIDKE
mmetsp:Transcript_4851/g.8664  ORF Transcript_4851/g.8664 Transcript_4851/m.8664 type:complete len:153 (+) Transcript_4851:252-710(+)